MKCLTKQFLIYAERPSGASLLNNWPFFEFTAYLPFESVRARDETV